MADPLPDKPRRTPISFRDKGWQFAEDHVDDIRALLDTEDTKVYLGVYRGADAPDNTTAPERSLMLPWQYKAIIDGFCAYCENTFEGSGWGFCFEKNDTSIAAVATRV